VGGIADISKLFPTSPVHKHQPDRPSESQADIADSEIFKVEGATLRAVHSPGHTTDHMALILEEEDAMFTGDNVLGHGTAVFEDLTSYLTSLERMRSLFGGRAYPGHGAVIEDGKAKISDYIRHRQLREDQVVQVLKSRGDGEGWSSMEIVKVIYRDVPETLHLPAHGGIMQVLGKLDGEEKIEEVDGKWRVKGRSAL
jgi:ribonuclease/clavin/mitogillin